MSTSDPGGGSSGQQDISNLQENLSRQQEKISALKELVRKSEAAHGKSTSSAQEKVKNIAQRLNQLKSKARSRQSLDRSTSELRDDPILEESQLASPIPSSQKVRAETPGSEKIQLLRRQVEESKIKMAERENSKREIEELVTQLKAKFDSTQQSLERSSELGRSMGDLSVLSPGPVKEKFKSATDLSFTPLNLDKERVKFLENRIRLLEKQLEKQATSATLPKTESELIKLLESKILDLEENLKEKECIIEARTKAVSLMTESLSAKGKTTVDALEDTRQEMFKMQNSFIETEDTLRADIRQLKDEIDDKCQTINNLKEVNDILETARFDLTIKNAELESKMQDGQEYSTKLSELNKLNESLQHRIEDLESQKYEIISTEEVDMAKQVGTEFANTMQSLNDRIVELETENDYLKKLAQSSQQVEPEESVGDQIKTLEATIASQRAKIEKQQAKIEELEEHVTEKTVECNVLNANFSVLQEKLKASAPKSLFSKSTDEEAEIEITKLKSQLDESNKSGIKTKLKMKQLQKQVDKFKKISDANSEVIRLTDENQQLQLKMAELEEEKGSLQLKLLGGGSSDVVIMSDNDLEKKLQVLETTCQNQTSAIQLLEEQKLDMTENWQTTKHQLESLKDQIQEIDKEETARVFSQMESVQLEEQVKDYLSQIAEIRNELERVKLENERLRDELHAIDDEKQELSKKIDHYVTENIELLDKVEKLSKSSSSAESIEIVERLTQQEKLEIEAFNKKMAAEEHDVEIDTENKTAEEADSLMGEELSDSLVKLREESSELMHRIELFTTERREVLEKMEILKSENQEYLHQIRALEAEKCAAEDGLTKSKLEVVSLEDKLDVARRENKELVAQVTESSELKIKLENEIKILKETRETTLLSPTVSNPETLQQCSTSLSRLHTELENYRKSNDKSSRLNASKKLAKEAKNAYQQLQDLIEKLKMSSLTQGPVDELSKSAVEELGQSATEDLTRKCAEFEEVVQKLQAELKNSKDDLQKKHEEIDRRTAEFNSFTEKSNLFETETGAELAHLENIRRELESKLTTSDKEIEILKTLVAEQKQQLIESYTENEIELNAKLAEIQRCEEEIKRLNAELVHMQGDNLRTNENYAVQLKEEIKKLENSLSGNEKLLIDQTEELNNKQKTIETLNSQIMELYKTMEENSNKVFEKEDEIAYLQDLLDSNKSEMETLEKENNENKAVIEKLLLELHANSTNAQKDEMLADITNKMSHFELRVKELEQKNSDLESKSKEHLDKLKKFAANLKKKAAHCSELENKLKNISVNTPEEQVDSVNIVKALQTELSRYQEEIQLLKASESVKLEQEALLKELKLQRDTTTENYKILSVDYQNLQSELVQYKTKMEYFEQSLSEMQSLVEVLQVSANEKEEQFNGLQKELVNSQAELQARQGNLEKISEELRTKNLKFEKSKAVIKEKNREIQRLTVEIENLSQNKSSQSSMEIPPAVEFLKLKAEHEQLIQTYSLERETFQRTISRLETLHDGIQAKLQEDMGYIESLETENNNFKEKIVKLENCVASFEERRSSLERQTNMLDAQLQKRTDEFEKNEDALIYRLNMLSDHDDVIGRRLIETQEEKEELNEKLERLKQEHSDLLSKFTKLEKDYESFKTEKFDNVESERQTLHEQLENVRAELIRQQNIYEGRLASKHAEIDELENDLSIQLNKVNEEKRTLQENLEKSEDGVIELKDEIVRLKESANSLEQNKNDLEREITWIRMQNENLSQDQYEIQELRMQIMQDKTEIENQKHQLDTLVQNHEIELNALRQQITELDSMRMQVGQNQTDDQVFIETENKRLKEQLTEKEAAIENYQRENLKLQMAAVAAAAAPIDPFSSFAQPNPTSLMESNQMEIHALRERIQVLEIDLEKLQTAINEKDQLCNTARQEAHSAQENLLKAQQEVGSLRIELERLRPPVQEPVIQNPFYSAMSGAASVFDEIVAPHHVEPLGSGHTDLKKIEDLERNVSDLEKYANDLEIKLKHLTSVHESTLLQLQDQARSFDKTTEVFKERIQFLENQLKELEDQKSVESLIISQQPAAELVPSLDMFFSKPSPSVEFDRLISAPAQQPSGPAVVQEEIIVAKKAYLCYPEPEAVEIAAEEGWGWGPEEAALEESHQKLSALQSLSSMPATHNLDAKLKEYENRIQELELERNRLDEKIIELQVKCGKMMKKLKEYKVKFEQAESEKSFRKSASIESNDLDLAIQEELKSQVSKLEEWIIEMRKQHDKDTAEKENLAKRVDVLTSANERMTEMKERQDIEVQMHQTQVRQLSQHIKQLEDWGDQSEVSEPKIVSSIPDPPRTLTSSPAQAEIEAKLKDAIRELEDLQVDRDELQALLDDEKNNLQLGENKIKELQAKIVSLENSLSENDHIEMSHLEDELQTLRSLLAQKETDINNTILMNQNLQLQLGDYQSTIGQLSSESNSIKSQLDQLRTEHEEKVNENLNLSQELKSWMLKSQELSQEVEAMNSKTNIAIENTESNAKFEENLQELTAQLQYKDAEILHLKQKVEDVMREDQTQSLVQEILGKNQEIQQLKRQVQQLETDKMELENNLSIQLTNEMAQKTDDSEDLHEKIRLLESSIDEIRSEKAQMEGELQVLNQHVLESFEQEDKMKQTVLELDTKNIEIAELKNSLELYKQQQHKPDRDAESEDHVALLNTQWEATVEEKCSEIADSWRQYFEQRENEFKQIESNLNLEIEQLRAGIAVPKRKTPEEIELENTAATTNSLLVEKMQTALESQELEIVTLKEQLAMRSAEYARLAARHDPYALSTSSNLSFESKPQRKISNSSTIADQAVNKSELDLALYMLHQRDMRCEELTLELFNLIEERDTLQLKLSNCLRQVEEIKSKTGSGSESEPSASNPNSPEKSSKPRLGAVVSSEEDQQQARESDNLNSKLSQLHTVRHTKDKRVWEEREQRQRQMENIQQDVANIPSEAVSELVGADLSNTVQSPSTVLLNWLWGKNNSPQQS